MKARSQWFWGLLALALAASDGWAFINPIAIINTQPLAFGKFAAGSGGSVTVSAAGVRSAGSGVVLVSSVSSAAQFSVSGDPNLTYSITLPANGAVVLSSGANTMALSNFSSSPSPAGQLSAGGTQTLTVGATLTVGTTQATGSYSGSYDVIVNYN
jgi:hypothetical protein